MINIPVVCGEKLGGVCRIFSEKLTNQRQTSEGRGTLRRWLTVSDEFTVYMLLTTHAVAQWLCTVRLLLCMDIEANPGPEENSNILQIMEGKFAQVMHEIQAYTMNICRMIDEKWTNRQQFPLLYSSSRRTETLY